MTIRTLVRHIWDDKLFRLSWAYRELREVTDNLNEGPRDWPDGMEMIRQLRKAAGLFDGAMPITPKAAWEEAVAVVTEALGVLRDLAAAEAIRDEVIGQGGLTPVCRFCGAIKWYGPLEHEPSCVWHQARGVISSSDAGASAAG